jgi:hypothetical protein
VFIDRALQRRHGIASVAALDSRWPDFQSISGTHMTFGVLKQLPILPPDFYTDRRLAFITPKVLELTYTSHSLAHRARRSRRSWFAPQRAEPSE